MNHINDKSDREVRGGRRAPKFPKKPIAFDPVAYAAALEVLG